MNQHWCQLLPPPVPCPLMGDQPKPPQTSRHWSKPQSLPTILRIIRACVLLTGPQMNPRSCQHTLRATAHRYSTQASPRTRLHTALLSFLHYVLRQNRVRAPHTLPVSSLLQSLPRNPQSCPLCPPLRSDRLCALVKSPRFTRHWRLHLSQRQPKIPLESQLTGQPTNHRNRQRGNLRTDRRMNPRSLLAVSHHLSHPTDHLPNHQTNLLANPVTNPLGHPRLHQVRSNLHLRSLQSRQTARNIFPLNHLPHLARNRHISPPTGLLTLLRPSPHTFRPLNRQTNPRSDQQTALTLSQPTNRRLSRLMLLRTYQQACRQLSHPSFRTDTTTIRPMSQVDPTTTHPTGSEASSPQELRRFLSSNTGRSLFSSVSQLIFLLTSCISITDTTTTPCTLPTEHPTPRPRYLPKKARARRVTPRLRYLPKRRARGESSKSDLNYL